MSTCMYKMRPVLKHDEPLPKPTHNMYSLKPINDYVCKTPANTVRLSDLNGCILEKMKGSQGDISSLEKKQEEILQRLAQLKLDMKNLKAELNSESSLHVGSPNKKSFASGPEPAETHDIVVYANPAHPPYSLVALAKLWGPTFGVKIQNHTHSSVKDAPPEHDLFTTSPANKPHLSITLIWKNVDSTTELVINPVKHSAILGECNIIRYLSRVGPLSSAYENDRDLNRITEVDKVLDISQKLAYCNNTKEIQALIRSLNACLAKSQWMCGRPDISIMDVAVWSVLKQLRTKVELTQALSKWMECCDSLLL